MEGIQSTHIAAKYIFRIHQSSPLLTKRGEIRLSRRTKNSTYFALWWYVQSEDLTEVGAEYTTFSSIQLLSHVQLSVTPWTAACQASMSITNSWSLLKLISIQLAMPSKYLILCHSLLLRLQYFPASGSFPMGQFFTSVAKLLELLLQHQKQMLMMNYLGLISFRTDWFDLLEVQGTLQGLLQHHSSKASSSMLSFLYGATLISIHDCWKNHSLDQTDLCQQSNVSAV